MPDTSVSSPPASQERFRALADSLHSSALKERLHKCEETLAAQDHVLAEQDELLAQLRSQLLQLRKERARAAANRSSRPDVEIPTFDGTARTLPAGLWLDRCVRTYDMLHETSSKGKTIYAAQRLEAGPLAWWESLFATWCRKRVEPDWDLFMQEFRQRFCHGRHAPGRTG